jgi:uncharacterized protein (DUF433 family)
MIELTLDQVRAIAQVGEHPPTVIDPTTRVIYALVPTDVAQAPLEMPVEPWKHLVIRRHPWRKQLSLKGRNLTVRQLVGTVKANRFTEEQTAEDLDLPVEAIREALKYYDENPEVIALDHATELYLLSREGGRGRGPESLPG